MTLTGSGAGGSGGHAEGRVAHVTVQDAGHLVPMEKVNETAEHIGGWIGKEMVRYRDWERKTAKEWEGLEGAQRSVLTARFVEELTATMPPVEKKKKTKTESKL